MVEMKVVNLEDAGICKTFRKENSFGNLPTVFARVSAFKIELKLIPREKLYMALNYVIGNVFCRFLPINSFEKIYAHLIGNIWTYYF